MPIHQDHAPIDGHFVLLCGGVGGAKLALGLYRFLSPEQLTILVNVGDDFVFSGLPVCPDIDTVLYTLSGVENPETGWGRAAESWAAMETMQRLGGPGWFNLGDKDIGQCMARAQMFEAQKPLSEVTATLAHALGVECAVAPVTDDPLRTKVLTDAGLLSFQDYFVRRQCAPKCREIIYEGAGEARLSTAAAAALDRDDLRGIIVANSNPYLSIAPGLAIPEMRERLMKRRAPCVAVSPIVGGSALKGPLAKIMREFGLTPNAVNIANFYRGLIDALLVDQGDAQPLGANDQPFVCPSAASLIMQALDDKIALAREAVRTVMSIAEQRLERAAS